MGDGRELARLALPTSHITNLAFGGPDLRTLFAEHVKRGAERCFSAMQYLGNYKELHEKVCKFANVLKGMIKVN